MSQERAAVPEKRGRITSFLKKFNKISAAVFLTAGVVFESGPLIGLGLIDAGQSYLIGRYEKWRDRRQAGRAAGALTLKTAQ